MSKPLSPLHVQKILIFGAGGQVGRSASRIAQDEFPEAEIIPLHRSEADLANPTDVIRLLQAYQPQVVFNGAAFTQVDAAETRQKEAFRVNADAPGEIARWCKNHQAILVHFSTDYVFPGTGDQPWHESDPVGPLNIYGQSKAEGEHQIIQSGCRALIFRTSWVYDAWGKNFLKTILKLASERNQLKIISDQTGAPTYAPDLAQASLKATKLAIQKHSFPTGIYHLVNSGETSWHGFAAEILRLAQAQGIQTQNPEIFPIPSSEYPTPAQRPKNSRLSTELFTKTFGFRLRSWQEGLGDCLSQLLQAREAESLPSPKVP